MSEPKKIEQSSSNTVDQIRRLRDEFTSKARNAEVEACNFGDLCLKAKDEANRYKQQAEILNTALKMVEADTQKQNIEILKADAKAALDSLSNAKLTKRSFTFLIDGSGSMSGSPIKQALSAVGDIQQKLEEKGASVSVFMYGDQNPVSVDLKDGAARKKAEQGLNYGGTSLAPALNALSTTTSSGHHNVIVISDGDLDDTEASKLALEKLLMDHPKMTLDAVVIPFNTSSVHTENTLIERFLSDSHTSLAQKPVVSKINNDFEMMGQAITVLLVDRLNQKMPKARNKPAPG